VYFAPCPAWWSCREENDRAWKVGVEDVLRQDESGNHLSVNLDLKNPRAQKDLEHMTPETLVQDILAKERKIMEIVAEIGAALRAGVPDGRGENRD
jgi:type I restriction enzyme M protein